MSVQDQGQGQQFCGADASTGDTTKSLPPEISGPLYGKLSLSVDHVVWYKQEDAPGWLDSKGTLGACVCVAGGLCVCVCVCLCACARV